MQMIFQDPYASLNPRMTVYDTLAEPLLLHGLVNKAGLDQAIRELMDNVGLARAFVRKYPHEFSGGQRQRIAIGRALATRPEFIVADEPVSALDVTIQAQILDLLADLTREYGLTMLFISHDLAVIRQIADRIAVMYHGKLVEEGSTAQVFDSPQGITPAHYWRPSPAPTRPKPPGKALKASLSRDDGALESPSQGVFAFRRRVS